MLARPIDLHFLKLQHLRMDQVTTTLLMLTLVAIVTSSSVDEVSASSKYEEMGPLPVHSFQTSSPSWMNAKLCKPSKVDTPIVTNGTNGYHPPPAHLFVAAPSVGGHYPVLLFKHGTLLANYAYSQILLHIASYGYIVVAPQASINMLSFDAIDEIKQTIEFQDWLPGNLSMLLLVATPEEGGEVVPDLERMMISGHSRGGKVAYAMALGLLQSKSQDQHVKYVGLFALDPVDGAGKPMEPPIVTRDDVDLAFPVFILGTEYGSQCALPCAPPCCSHSAYAKVTRAEWKYHVKALEYGHMDFLDDSWCWPSIMCKRGNDKERLRKVSAALLLSFFESVLTGSRASLVDAISNASIRLDLELSSTTPSWSTTNLNVCPA